MFPIKILSQYVEVVESLIYLSNKTLHFEAKARYEKQTLSNNQKLTNNKTNRMQNNKDNTAAYTITSKSKSVFVLKKLKYNC